MPLFSKLKSSSLLPVTGLFALLLMGSGCASVKLGQAEKTSSEVAPAEIISSQRVILHQAAAQLQAKSWPSPSDKDMTDKVLSVLFGQDDDGTITEEQAVEIYIASVRNRTSGDSWHAVLAEADTYLAQGRALAEIGRQTSHSITPTDDDVRMLETAISDLREGRDIYMRSLDMLRDAGEPVSKDEISNLKRAFNQTIYDIGRTADIIADRADEDRPQLAQPATISDQ